MDAPVVVVTHRVPTQWVRDHPDAPFEFVTDGVAAAIARAQEIAGPRTVAVTAGTIAAQCLQLGLLDAAAIDLVPVVMGGGRAFFPGLSIEDVALGDPEVCMPSARVTHLRMPVCSADPADQPGRDLESDCAYTSLTIASDLAASAGLIQNGSGSPSRS